MRYRWWTILTNGWGNEEKRNALEKLIRGLVKEVLLNQDTRKKIDWGSLESFPKKQQNMLKSTRTATKAFKMEEFSEFEKAFMGLVLYLFIAEGLYSELINFVCFLLTLQGHDLFNYFGRDFACSLDEIAKVESHTKELFLNEHGFRLLNEGWDRNLRNNIAHCNFQIEDEGTTRINGIKTDINKKVDEIIDFVFRVDIHILQGMEDSRKHLSALS
jgi:hypothetical protein